MPQINLRALPSQFVSAEFLDARNAFHKAISSLKGKLQSLKESLMQNETVALQAELLSLNRDIQAKDAAIHSYKEKSKEWYSLLHIQEEANETVLDRSYRDPDALPPTMEESLRAGDLPIPPAELDDISPPLWRPKRKERDISRVGSPAPNGASSTPPAGVSTGQTKDITSKLFADTPNLQPPSRPVTPSGSIPNTSRSPQPAQAATSTSTAANGLINGSASSRSFAKSGTGVKRKKPDSPSDLDLDGDDPSKGRNVKPAVAASVARVPSTASGLSQNSTQVVDLSTSSDEDEPLAVTASRARSIGGTPGSSLVASPAFRGFTLAKPGAKVSPAVTPAPSAAAPVEEVVDITGDDVVMVDLSTNDVIELPSQTDRNESSNPPNMDQTESTPLSEAVLTTSNGPPGTGSTNAINPEPPPGPNPSMETDSEQPEPEPEPEEYEGIGLICMVFDPNDSLAEGVCRRQLKLGDRCAVNTYIEGVCPQGTTCKPDILPPADGHEKFYYLTYGTCTDVNHTAQPKHRTLKAALRRRPQHKMGRRAETGAQLLGRQASDMVARSFMNNPILRRRALTRKTKTPAVKAVIPNTDSEGNVVQPSLKPEPPKPSDAVDNQGPSNPIIPLNGGKSKSTTGSRESNPGGIWGGG
ncbi:hypothetical protein HDU96_010424 [Phlyctochytrium bullatum]|nr:hypothetical protein HDU96_010424 [Phlyctochytrium bullatum]